MAQSVRAILLASAIAASFLGLRASRLSNQSDAWPGLAKRITAVAPSTSSFRRVSLPCRLMRPCRRLPPEELSVGVRPSHAAKCPPGTETRRIGHPESKAHRANWPDAGLARQTLPQRVFPVQCHQPGLDL